MEIITITIEQDAETQKIGMYHSGAVLPAMGVHACELVAGAFRDMLIEAEVARRMAEQETEE